METLGRKEELRKHLKESFPEPLFKDPAKTKLWYGKWKQFNVENWYHQIKEETFPSSFVAVNYSLALALQESSKLMLKKKKEETNDFLAYLKENLPNHQWNQIEAFLQEIETSLSKNHEQGTFVRLSTLSPKDAILEDTEIIYPFIMKQLKQLETLDNKYEIEHAITTGIGQALKVHTGAMILFLLISSNRVRSDLKWMTGFGEEFWENNLIIRDWFTIPLEREFRCICVEKNITAVSQYAKDLYFKGLDAKSQEENRKGKVPLSILRQIDQFWKEKQNLIPYQTCVIDLAVLEGGETKIIEINPLDIYTGSLLFDWNTDYDIIVDGSEENQFKIANRICTEETHTGYIFAEWEFLFNQCKQEIMKEREEKNRNKNCFIM